MKLLNIIGLTIFSIGAFVLIGFGCYSFFQETEIPLVVKIGITTITLGIIVILISLIRERINEKDL
ncbi:MAG: hypothetical protein HQ536_00240 [Parcubacteria group bacterium]|nr:hypothetical protein [Parcubacteria group bacterium]